MGPDQEDPSPSSVPNKESRRLWIGNLDPRVTEYQLLKLLQQYGTIEKFDLLFHRSGPLSGQPRGYAFVTYTAPEATLKAKRQLHNKLLGTKRVTVTWAHVETKEEPEKPKQQLNIPALGIAKADPKVSRSTQIEAIEAKLRLMEQKRSEELEINKTVAAEPPVISTNNIRKPEMVVKSNNGMRTTKMNNLRKHDRRGGPYNKRPPRR